MNANIIKFALRKITTLQFATVDSVQVQLDTINLNYGFGFGLNEENKIVGCSVKFEFFSNSNLFIVINVLCDFAIEPESWESFIDKEKNVMVLPISIATHLATLTVGTARGILHAKTENTDFNKYFIPTINVTDSLKEDVVIPLLKV